MDKLYNFIVLLLFLFSAQALMLIHPDVTFNIDENTTGQDYQSYHIEIP